MVDDIKQPDPLEIPDFLRRSQDETKVPSMSEQVTAESVIEETPPKAKKPKAEKPAKKAAAKPKAKTAKGSEKTKAAKPKAEKKAKAEKDQFGLRKGSTRSEAAAMYARKSGATLEEVKIKVGSIQLNVLNELEANGFEVKKEKQERKGKRPVTRYWLFAKK